jgi:uncharacterized SAM-binding protein YcdF (DUF218 family)
VAALLLLSAVTHTVWLGAMGSYLVRGEEPFRADIAVVLGGDGYGNRIVKAAQLVRQGYVPLVLVSGPPGFYDVHENDLAIPFAVRRGYPESWFVPLPVRGRSTSEEAAELLTELSRRQVRRFIVVTSDYHTRRAGRIFHSMAPQAEFRIVAAPDEFFTAHGWWKTREGRKQFAFEWLKTVSSWFGV